jgi:putative nucleotidyltransferase with HDIG domain
MLKRIPVKNLSLGMFVAELCGSWEEHPFEKTKFLLTSQADLDSMLSCGIKEVWIDTAKGIDDSATKESLADVKKDTEKLLRRAAKIQKFKESQKIKPVSMDQEIRTASKVCARAKEAVINMFGDARMGKAIEIEQIQDLVEEISDSVMRQPHALISLARLKNSDEYTYMHSVAVCALMIALARQMNLDDDMVQEAGLAGLLHDIGKMSIPMEILNKPGKLTDDEFTTVKSHPEMGSQILMGNPLISVLVLDVVLHHHEKMDGSGYPHKLQGDNISLFAKMGAVCDVYDAITSDRPYKKGWAPAESIRKMAEWSNGHFDESVFQAFVKTVGIYPTGSFVRLESGRLGVVTKQTAESLLSPCVKIFYSAKLKTPIPIEEIDLSKLHGKDKIIGRESAEDWGFRNLDELWMGS